MMALADPEYYYFQHFIKRFDYLFSAPGSEKRMDLAVCLEFYPGFRNLVLLVFRPGSAEKQDVQD